MTTPAAHLPAVWRLIEVLRDASRADRAHWPSFAHAFDRFPVPVSEAGAVAHVVAKAATRVLSQLAHAHPSGEAAMRLSLLSLSDVLNQEANANGCPYPKPFHLRD
jgi:hypothetical protein